MQVLNDFDPAPVRQNIARHLTNPLSAYLGYQLRRASHAMMLDLSERLSPLGLTVVKGSILMLIDCNPDITQIRIARTMSIKRANMAPLVASMEQQGLIYRKRVDGRSQGLNLTEKGQEITRQVIAITKESEQKFTAGIDKALMERMCNELNEIWVEKPTDS